MLRGFPAVETRPARITHRRPGNMIEIRSKIRAILCGPEKIQKYESVVEFESSANGIGTAYSVAVTRRLIHSSGYLVDSTGKLLSL